MSTTFTWYGHAALGLETSGYKILVDPFFSGNPAASISADKVPADFILITHGHGDHVGDAVSIAKRTGALVISNFEIANWFEKQGTKSHGQHLGGGFKHPFGYLKLTLALHGSGLPDGSYGGNPAGFLLTTVDGQKLYIAGDTGLFGDMKLIGEYYKPDLILIPIGGHFTMGPKDAAYATNKWLKPKYAIPMHYGTNPFLKGTPKEYIEALGNTDTKVLTLNPGEQVEF